MDLVFDMLNVGVFVGEDEVPVVTIPQGSQTNNYKLQVRFEVTWGGGRADIRHGHRLAWRNQHVCSGSN
jgi:hypothetical protein